MNTVAFPRRDDPRVIAARLEASCAVAELRAVRDRLAFRTREVERLADEVVSLARHASRSVRAVVTQPKISGHEHDPVTWIKDARSIFDTLMRHCGAGDAEAFWRSLEGKGEVAACEAALPPVHAGKLVDLRDHIAASLDLAAPLGPVPEPPGAPQASSPAMPDVEPGPEPIASPDGPEPPLRELWEGKPVAYDDDRLSDIERAELNAAWEREQSGPVEAAYLLEGRRYPLAELVAAYEALVADPERDPFEIRRIRADLENSRERDLAYRDCRYDHAIMARMERAWARLEERLGVEKPRRKRATKAAVSGAAALRTG